MLKEGSLLEMAQQIETVYKGCDDNHKYASMGSK